MYFRRLFGRYIVVVDRCPMSNYQTTYTRGPYRTLPLAYLLGCLELFGKPYGAMQVVHEDLRIQARGKVVWPGKEGKPPS